MEACSEQEVGNARTSLRRRIVRGFTLPFVSPFKMLWRRSKARRQNKRRRRALPIASMSSYMASPDELLHAEDADLMLASGEEQLEHVSTASRNVLNLSKSSFFPLRFVPVYTWSNPTHSAVCDEQPHSNKADDDAVHVRAVRPQVLLACGSRTWGSNSWMDARNLLGIRLYDYAVYADEQLARGSILLDSKQQQQSAGLLTQPMPPQSPWPPPSLSSGQQLLDYVLRTPDIPMSIVLRAARDIPLDLLQSEMSAVLERRLVKAGGSPSSPDLARLLQCFSSSTLPAMLRKGSTHVKHGAAMLFSRSPLGDLHCSAFPTQHSMLLHVPSFRTTHACDDCTDTSAHDVVKHHDTSAHDVVKHHDPLSYTNNFTRNPWLQPITAVIKAGLLPWHSGGKVKQGCHVRELDEANVTAGLLAAPLLPQPMTDPLLSRALLDLYLGDMPVSKVVKGHAVETLETMGKRLNQRSHGMPSGPAYAIQSNQTLRCPDTHSDVNACVLQLH